MSILGSRDYVLVNSCIIDSKKHVQDGSRDGLCDEKKEGYEIGPLFGRTGIEG